MRKILIGIFCLSSVAAMAQTGSSGKRKIILGQHALEYYLPLFSLDSLYMPTIDSGAATGGFLTVDFVTKKVRLAAGGSGGGITALTGDVTASGTGSVTATLASVNANVGSFTNANITVDAKGRILGVTNGSGGGSLDATPTDASTNGVESNGVFDALALKAPLASPALTGTPTAPTAALYTNTTQIATTAHVYAVAGFSFTTITAAGSAGTMSQVHENITVVDPASALGATSITTPASPVAGDIITITAGGTIASGASVCTAFTLTPNSGQTIYGITFPTALVGADGLKFIYDSNTSMWRRLKF